MVVHEKNLANRNVLGEYLRKVLLLFFEGVGHGAFSSGRGAEARVLE
eukprot:SAG31_NODE_27869_length_418_cov_85.241379_1_plen_46_part_01